MNPYSDLPDSAFWRKGVTANPCDLVGIYSPKFTISKSSRVMTAGSCFAQHVGRHLKMNGFSVLDYEPAPKSIGLNLKKKYQYGVFSARYGNIYTVRQMRQLISEALGKFEPLQDHWLKGQRFYDPFRPNVYPEGFASSDELRLHRMQHLKSIHKLLRDFDVLVFTLGLTEAWVNNSNDEIYTLAPGVVAGDWEPSNNSYRFINFNVADILSDFDEIVNMLNELRGSKPYKVILTVSPVPLAATAAGCHVLASTILSKAILRVSAAELTARYENIDYFPSYEIIMNPANNLAFWESDLRSVKEEGVETVMKHFFLDASSREYVERAAATPENEIPAVGRYEDLDASCDEQLLDSIKSNE